MPSVKTAVADPPTAALAALLTAFKREQGLTQETMAAAFHVAPSTIHRLLHGKFTPTRFPDEFFGQCRKLLQEPDIEQLIQSLETLAEKNRLEAVKRIGTTLRTRTASQKTARSFGVTVHNAPDQFLGAPIQLHSGELGLLEEVLIAPKGTRRGIVRFRAETYWRAVFVEDIAQVLEESTKGQTDE